MNCGNQVAENGGEKKNLATKKIVAMTLLKWRGKKNCGNGIAEIKGKKKLWQWNCRNRREKKMLWHRKLEESIN